MERRSPKSPLLYERYKSGCAWSLIKFCDFGPGDSNSKLISDGKGLNSQVLNELDIKNRLGLVSKSEGKCQCVDGGANKKSQMITNAKGQHVKSDTQLVGHLPTNYKRKASKAFQIHGCKDIKTMGPSYVNSAEKSSKTLNKATQTEGSFIQAHTEIGRDCSCRGVSHQKCSHLGEINLQVEMNEAAEAFLNQKFCKGKFLGKKKASHQSKHFLDALEILNSNKELFISLLQDPNSLLVKHIQDLRQSQANEHDTKSSFSESKLPENCGTTVRESTEHGCNKNSCDRYSTNGSFDPQTSERIVVLKPGSSAGDTCDCSSPQSLYSLGNRVQSAKPAYFSFGHMKRKLSHAIGLSRKAKNTSTDCTRHKSPCDVQSLGECGKGKIREIGESNELSEYQLGTGEMAKSSSVKRRDKLGNVKDSESDIKEQVAFNGGSDHGNSTLSVVRHLKQSESNVYIEARKRLSEVLRNRNEDFSRKHVPLNSGSVVSLPENDLLYGFYAEQMRFSPYSYYQMVNEKKQQFQKEKKNGYLSPMRQIIEAPSLADYKRFTDQLKIFDTKPNDSGNHFPDIKRHGSVCSPRDTSSSRGAAYNTVNHGEISSFGEPLEPNDLRNNGVNQSAGPTNTYEDYVRLECSKLDPPWENCTSPSSEDAYSSTHFSIKRPEDSDGMKDKAEHASPVSVLEQFFFEDITSHISTISQSAEPAGEPKQDSYEEHYSTSLLTSPQDLKINSNKAMDEHESMSKYITAVLRASGIKWEQLSMKCHSSDQLLEPSLLDEVELLPDQLTVDHNLLFDYINEVLLELYQCYFSCSPCVPFLKPKVQPVHSEANLVNEVMQCVDLDILFHPQFQTMDQLVQKDLAKSRTWMDIRIDTEVAVTELVESVLEELALEISIDLHI